MDQPSTGASFRPQGPEASLHLYLSGVEGDAGALLGQRVAGLPLSLSLCPVTEWIDVSDLSHAAVAVVQVNGDNPASIKRFTKLAEMTDTPLIAAMYDPPLALFRFLLKNGARDVLPLPLNADDLASAVTQILAEPTAAPPRAAVPVPTAHGRLVLFVKSHGGAGATALASQLAARTAAAGGPTALIDFDVQFGDAAFQLGLKPPLSVLDLVEAGPRLDGQLLRSVAAEHSSGLRIIAAPPQLTPLDALSSDQVLAIVDRAVREYATVFVDLPANWTNWSLSLIARADKVLLVTELSITALNRARRQLDLLAEQDLGNVPLQLILNRAVRKRFGGGQPLKEADVERVLGRAIDFTVSDDPDVLSTALQQGVPIDAVRRKSAIGKDLDVIRAALAAAFDGER
ncbi:MULTISPECIES: AAA family ATPase [Sphingomonas]|uniref:AAA family ATPase n=1 Tax=Sphingomonas TaxID=13687 RepID=UPI000DEF3BA5|nr:MULTISPECIES: hypothetical protein [Sphingomonas]